MLSQEEIKKQVGTYAAGLIRDGMSIGIGSGTTASYFISELGKRVADGLKLVAVPTSSETARTCRLLHIPLTSLDQVDQLDLTIDGADEIDPNGDLIKGGGGALLQEKIVAASSARLIIIADQSKRVPALGTFPLPVEVIPFGQRQVAQHIRDSFPCKEVTLRQKNGRPILTDHHHHILDCQFERIEDPRSLNEALHLIPGVVETGLFIHMSSEIIIGFADGSVKVFPGKRDSKPAAD